VFVQYGASNAAGLNGCNSKDFLRMDEFQQHVASADVLIMHAGAGSVIHAIRSGKVPVVVPRQAQLGEHIDNHQNEFANQLRDTGKAVVCTEPQQLLAAVKCAMDRQNNAKANYGEPALVRMVRGIIVASMASRE
jgi:UDP-N-acetylglucosamine transferase subunit ALG13